MRMMRIMIVALLASASACGGDNGPTHWSKQPLETVNDTFGGTAYTIELPKGMRKSSVESKYDVEYAYHANVGDEDYVFAPNVSVGKADKKQALAEALKGESAVKAPTDVLFQEETATGFVYAIANDAKPGKEDYLIRGQTFVGDGALTCSARLYPMNKKGTAKEHIPLVAKMCTSLKPK